MDEFRSWISEAARRYVSERQIQVEVWMAESQSGHVAPLESHLGEIFRNADDDTHEVCEAFVNGCVLNYRFDDAHTVLQLWRRDFPSDPRPPYIEARLREHLSEYDAAERGYRESLNLESDFAPALFNLARLQVVRQKTAEALELYRRCASLLEEPQPAQVGTAQCLRLLNRYEEARRELLLAAERTGLLVEDSYRLLGEPAETAVARVAVEMGQLCLDERRYEESVRWYEKALTANPLDWKARFNYATALHRAGQMERAAPEFQSVSKSKAAMERADVLLDKLRDNPANLDIRSELGRIFLEHSSERQGLIWLNAVLRSNPAHQETHRALARYHEGRIVSDPASARLAAHHQAHSQGVSSDE